MARDFFKGFKAFEKVANNLPYGKAVIYGGQQTGTRQDIHILNPLGVNDFLDGIIYSSKQDS